MKIFPDSVIDQSYEQIIFEHNKRSSLLYSIIIFALVGIFISFFFIRIDVGTSVVGTVQSRGNIMALISPADGILHIFNISENIEVKQGDTIFIVSDLKTNHKYTVCSPIDGICTNTSKLVEGLKVSLGQQLIDLIPNSELCVECNVFSKDLGLLRVGLPCNIQVDAYNYNQWGMLKGMLVEIADNPTVTYQGVFYKVYSSLDKDYLELKNGHRGYLKRGMNVNCRFIVNNRRIIDLLYDNVENWINPLK
ncbi:HlyD family efflux transporter periplasmic adaptor subunit [Butyricimonas faecalis]|uniref:HlyD family efflux transporter periplasmic adaptor subunit n=1 Tax=Butyricimonas faecalis TaxID=2093856 RepID=A0A3S9VV33_9BACT|nr:HlyD family efflux transporter periplasmic adaptor subunit [Butyricimonas faecalis]AZS30388.1 HlyD family efflux transporter periplasmic adaptor subunit [Butyricimonas faecalis]